MNFRLWKIMTQFWHFDVIHSWGRIPFVQWQFCFCSLLCCVPLFSFMYCFNIMFDWHNVSVIWWCAPRLIDVHIIYVITNIQCCQSSARSLLFYHIKWWWACSTPFRETSKWVIAFEASVLIDWRYQNWLDARMSAGQKLILINSA